MKMRKGVQLVKEGSKIDSFLANRYGSALFSYRQIFAMLGPLIIDQFFIYLIGMLTNAMISASSQESVTAVGLVNPITMLATAIFFAASSGGTVIVAQYKGKGDAEMVKKAAAQVVTITFLIATVAAILLIAFAVPVINTVFGDAEQLVKDKACAYLRGFCLSMIPFSIYNGIFSVLRGIGDTKTCLRLTVIINIIHLFASMLFLNVMKLDIMGTALSYNVARLIGGGIAIYLILNPRGMLTLKFRDFLSLRWKLQKSIIRLGVPFAVEQIFLNLGALAAQMYIVVLGTTSVAANAIASSASNLIYGAGFAVSTLAITVVGQCIGANDKELAKKYGKCMIELGTIVMLISTAIIYPLMPFILNLYAPLPETLALIKQLILIGIVPIPFFWALSYVMPATLRAAGDANFSSVACLISMWVFRVGLGYLLAIPCGMGVQGVWISIGAEWAARAVIFGLRFKGNKWHRKKIVD